MRRTDRWPVVPLGTSLILLACLGATDGTRPNSTRRQSVTATAGKPPGPSGKGQAQGSERPESQNHRRISRIFAGDEVPTADDLTLMQERIQSVSKQVIASTVGVRVGNAHGSGVVVSDEGHVLTAAHVAMQANQDAIIIMSDGKEYPGTTLGMELGLDAGMVKLTPAGPVGKSKWPHLKMAENQGLRRGQWCLATGHPGGFRIGRKPVLRIGKILNRGDDEILTDCTLVGGDSGGPLLDMQGRVIGIHSRIGAPLTANLHVPVSVFSEQWESLVNSETHGPYLGVRPDDRATDQAKIQFVPEGSPAAKAGIKPGDVVVSFDENEIRDFNQPREHVLIKRPGDTVTLEVLRNGENLRVKVALGDWSDSTTPAIQR